MAFVTKKTVRLADPGAELLDRMTGFWDRYGRLTTSIAGGVAAVAVIGFLYLRAQGTTEEKAAGKLAEAEIMFWQGYYPRSFEGAQQVIRQYPNTQSAIEAHRLAGDDAYWRGDPGDFKRSVEEYKQYLARKNSGLLADAVRRSLAYALESNASALAAQGSQADAATGFREAATAYEGLVGRFPDRESSAEFLIAAARCYRQINQPREAAKRLQRVLDEFGETAASNRARIELAEATAGSH